MRQLVSALLCTVALSTISVASAADLPMKAPVYNKAPVMAPVTDWAGFYIGGNVGYGWDPANATFNPSLYATTLLGPLGGPFVDTGPDSGPVALRVAPKGWLGGGQFGYNWQQNALVYGLEADFDFSGMKASASAPLLRQRDGRRRSCRIHRQCRLATKTRLFWHCARPAGLGERQRAALRHRRFCLGACQHNVQYLRSYAERAGNAGSALLSLPPSKMVATHPQAISVWGLPWARELNGRSHVTGA